MLGELATGKSPEPAGWKACATFASDGITRWGRRIHITKRFEFVARLENGSLVAGQAVRGWDWRLESRQNPQAGKPALRSLRTESRGGRRIHITKWFEFVARLENGSLVAGQAVRGWDRGLESPRNPQAGKPALHLRRFRMRTRG